MASTHYTRPEYPTFVEFVDLSKRKFASVRLDSLGPANTKDLARAILQLAEEGYQYDECSHDLGYYDSVDNKTLEFSK